jgi:uncharacterized surface protein with fasciclin (FAS1) repeats
MSGSKGKHRILEAKDLPTWRRGALSVDAWLLRRTAPNSAGCCSALIYVVQHLSVQTETSVQDGPKLSVSIQRTALGHRKTGPRVCIAKQINTSGGRDMSLKSTVAAVVALGVTAAGFAGPAEARNSPVPGKPGKSNIVEIALAVNAGPLKEFDYLLAAAQCEFFNGAIVGLLTSPGPWTLFAPTDAAFEAVQRRVLGAGNPNFVPAPAKTCDLGPDILGAVLQYHVTDGRRFSNSVFNRNSTKMVEMLNGQFIVTNPNKTINDVDGQTVGVVSGLVNVNASNGVIHVIDKVLLPIDLP